MKKNILTVMTVLGLAFANAQEQTAKGKWIIEANTGLVEQIQAILLLYFRLMMEVLLGMLEQKVVIL